MTCLRTAAPNRLLTLRLDRCFRSSNYSRRREVLPLTFLSTDFNKELMSAQDPPVIVSHPDLAGLTRILSSVFLWIPSLSWQSCPAERFFGEPGSGKYQLTRLPSEASEQLPNHCPSCGTPRTESFALITYGMLHTLDCFERSRRSLSKTTQSNRINKAPEAPQSRTTCGC